MKKNSFLLTIITFFLFSCFLTNNCFAYTYSATDTQKIAQGITLNKITQFSENGWTYLYVIEIDASSSNVRIDALTSENGVSHFSTIKNTMEKIEGKNDASNVSHIIAGLNGDYFATRPNTNDRGQSIGTLISNNQLLNTGTNLNAEKDSMASFILSDTKILYEYIKETVTLISPKTEESFITCGINKYLPYNSIGIYDSNWSNSSIGNSEGNWLVELVVIDDTVTEIRENIAPCLFPENGYIVSAYGQNAIDYVLNNFSIGDKISYSIDTNIDLNKTNFAISGGTMLVINGEIPTFSHIVWGNNEMSAIGSSKDMKKIYLVACTQTNNSIVGISQKNFAKVLKDYGIYNALCLDGGGSTTMVANELQNNALTTTFSENSYLRSVPNGIGIFSLAKPTDTLGGLILTLNSDHIFVNNKTTFNITGYDTNYYYKDIDLSKIKITFNNNNAKYENEEIIGLKGGKTIITASYGKVSVKKEITIMDKISSITISPNTVNIRPGGLQNFSVIGTDENGYSASIDNSLLTWKLDDKIIDPNNISINTSGNYILSATIDNVTSYVPIYVTTKTEKVFDDFETLNGIFSGYPSNITGSAKTNSKAKNGKKSVKLSYNFIDTNAEIKGAYYDYAEPLELPLLVDEIGVWIYSPKKNTNSIKAQYTSKGNTKKVCVLANEIDWTGWKYLTFPSASSIKNILSIYVAQSNIEEENNSYICLDKLTVSYFTNNDETIITPNNITIDSSNTKIDNGFCISLLETLNTPHTLFENLQNTRIISSLNNQADLALFTNSLPEENILAQLSCNAKCLEQYSTLTTNNVTIISINCDNSGIKNTNFSQWENYINDIKNAKNNILVILSKPLDSFIDDKEKNLFLSLLEEQFKDGKNCWIVQIGNSTNVETYNGIKIFTIGNLTLENSSIETIIDKYKYINIYVTKNDMFYEIKPFSKLNY